MKLFGHGRLTVAVAATLFAFALPLTAQDANESAGTVAVTGELIDVLVGALALQNPSSPSEQATEHLLSVLVGDPLVAAVLQDAGAVDVPTPSGASAWGASADRMQELLSSGTPGWFTEAIQVSVDRGLPIVTPLNVLLVLVDSEDPVFAAFLTDQELAVEPLRTAIQGTLAELARHIG